MRRRGLFRLWVVLTVVFVPALAFWQVHELIKTWDDLDKITIQTCVNQEDSPTFNVDDCVRKSGAYQSVFEREHTTAGAYWGEAVGISFLIDVVLTALIVGVFLVCRWVVRGFKAEPK